MLLDNYVTGFGVCNDKFVESDDEVVELKVFNELILGV